MQESQSGSTAPTSKSDEKHDILWAAISAMTPVPVPISNIFPVDFSGIRHQAPRRTPSVLTLIDTFSWNTVNCLNRK